MNAVSYAITFVKEEIPQKTLWLGLRERVNKINRVLSVDEKLRSQVILPTVIRDLNLNSYITHHIKLSSCNVKNVDPITNTYVIEIGDHLLGGREVISAEMILKRIVTTGMSSSGSQALDMLEGAMSEYNESPIVTSRLELIGRNTILANLANKNLIMINDSTVVVNITKDSTLKHLHPSTHMYFGELVTLATKRHIYNKLRESLDKGYIENGHEVSVVKEIVNEYSDASAMYKEFYRTKWQPIEFSNDKTKLSNMIGMMCGVS